MTYEEEERLMPELARFPHACAAVVLALNMGLRRMGILRLRADDVNLIKRTLSYTAKGGKVRFVPLNAEAASTLEPLLKEATPNGYLFHRRTGHYLSPRAGAFQLAVKRAKIEDLHLHDLRRTCATRLLGAGVNPLVIE